jgi:hypothetical protein
MPLITIKSNLTNIKFGNDRPLGGSSKQPYIKFPVPSQFATDETINGSNFFSPQFANLNPGQVAPVEFLDLYRANESGLDFPIRGGLNFNIGTQTFTLSSKLDKTRIKRFFDDAPRGSAFIQKQIGLQLSNPKIETGNTLYGFGQSVPFPGLLENTRVYNNGLNTLAQVGVQGTGFHATRHGLVPFNPGQKYYYDIVNAQNVNNTIETNRLLILNNLKMSTSATQFTDPNNLTNINTVNTLGISLNKNLIFQYLGGPGSVYGVGTTTIKRVVDTTKLKSRNAMIYQELKEQTINANRVFDKETRTTKVTTNIQDFRNTTQGDGWTGSPLQTDKRFYVSAGSYKDKMNLLYPFVFKNDTAPWELDKTGTDDLIKFVFEAISNDDPSYSMALFFRAFLTAGITDNNTAQLNAFKYQGRGENFYTYQGFDRTIGFSFRVAAGSKDELRPLYNKVNSLISQVYPDYSPKQGIMRAPVVRITIGDYLYRVPGFLESVNVTIDNNYPWEVNLEKSQTGDIAQLPQVMDIAISFKPIMDILPKRASINKLIETTAVTNNINQETTTVSTSIPALIANVKYGPKESPISFIKPGDVVETTSRYVFAENKPFKFTAPNKINPFESTFDRDVRTGDFFNAFATARLNS